MSQAKVLVVGATGQLGAVVVGKLCARGIKVRALARPDSAVAHLWTQGVELMHGDLCDASSLEKACRGVEYVVTTATAATPRRSADRINKVDGKGHRDLIDAARRAGVKQLIYTSVAQSPHDFRIPLVRMKRAAEQHLRASGLTHTIVRAAAFMDISFAMIGSDLPIIGSTSPTVERPFWFTRWFFQRVRRDIERGRVSVAGDGRVRHSFISIDDVSEYLVRSVNAPVARNKTFDVGGPEALSILDVVGIYERILGKKLRVSATPAFTFRLLRALLAPFSPAAANIMAINHLAATESGLVPDAAETAARFGMSLTTAEQFLRNKLRLQAMGAG
jgi:uncharacterized protein YbjT (DUF2867 family)